MRFVQQWSSWLWPQKCYDKKINRTFQLKATSKSGQNDLYSGAQASTSSLLWVQLLPRNITASYIKEKLPVPTWLFSWRHDGMERNYKIHEQFCSAPRPSSLHLQLTVPLGSRDQTLSSTDLTFSHITPYACPLISPLCSRPLSLSDGWRGLLWRRSVGTLLVLVSKLKLCLRDRLQHPG